MRLSFERVATDEQIAFVNWCIANDRMTLFYKRKEWKHTRNTVMHMDHNECVRCKNLYHRIRKANVVHHVNHIDDRPDLCLNIYDEQGERNLISLCNSCHNEVHPEKQIQFRLTLEERKKLDESRREANQITKERW